MKHRILTALLAVAVCLGVIASFVPGALAFSDINDSDMAEAVEVLHGLGIVDGYSDGGYHPNETLTRAQFSKLAVLAEGHGDQVSSSAYRTLFSDVPGSSWAAPYVNQAYSEGPVSGYGDGTFGPDDPVTMGQAVTIVLRLMGYTDEDIGPFWPQDYMSAAAGLGLTDGISKTSGQNITRGEAALLLYAMLQSDDADGTAYITRLCTSYVEEAVVLDNDDEADDGTDATALVYAGGNLANYEQSAVVPDALLGKRGTLLLDKTGRVSGFLPDGTVSKSITVKEATAAALTGTDGKSYTVSSGTTVVLDGEKTTYSDCWYDLENKDSVVVYYTASGSIDLVTATGGGKYDGILLTGFYENAVPNTANPTKIQLLGVEFEIADSALADVQDCAVGDKVTVSLNAAGEVTALWPASEKRTVLYGVVNVSGSNGSVTLTSGLTISGEISTTTLDGALVQVTSSGIGTLSVVSVSRSSANKLNVTAGTLGTTPLAEDVAIYERVGNSTVVSLDLEDILVDSVAAADIDFYATNDDGEISVLLINDVTGNAYTYGLLTVGQEAVAGLGNGDSTTYNTTIGVENSTSDGTQMYLSGQSVSYHSYGGIAVTPEGRIADVVTLTRVTGVSRSSFDGTDYVVVDGLRTPIAENVQVYNTETEQWTTLEAAKSYADSFTVYYDQTLSGGGQIRVILTE